ncbi:hypothetical protein MFIFM68171_08215 [Madurella fahalii]|uniref:Uncharacterized protein n=1 Tax=Madurella fahalii TaxID=1157608 RepID=A0ABQ0GJQ8_9PEZI
MHGREIAWSQTRLFLGKILWTFDLEGVRGHERSIDKDFSVHVMWNRPELYVRFLPAKGQDVGASGADDHPHQVGKRPFMRDWKVRG